MVSFQCEGCGDVVKKPKLDKHGSMCNSPFTCIDCSKTFSGPAEWKSHTQCISEAEKYQKGLYKGPRDQQNGGPRDNAKARTNGGRNAPASGTGTYQAWGRNNGPPGGGPAWGRQYTRYEGTGANVTPLGTPARMSPVTTPSPAESEKDDPIKNTSVAPAKVTAAASADKASAASTKPADAVVDREKSKKSKKRKAPSAEEEAAYGKEPPKKVKIEQDAVTSAQSVESSQSTPTEKKQKKRKKDKNLKESLANGDVESDVKKESVKGQEETESSTAQEASKKRKKDRKNAEETQVVLEDVDAALEQAADIENKKKEKKERKEKKHKKSKLEVER